MTKIQLVDSVDEHFPEKRWCITKRRQKKRERM